MWELMNESQLNEQNMQQEGHKFEMFDVKGLHQSLQLMKAFKVKISRVSTLPVEILLL